MALCQALSQDFSLSRLQPLSLDCQIRRHPAGFGNPPVQSAELFFYTSNFVFMPYGFGNKKVGQGFPGLQAEEVPVLVCFQLQASVVIPQPP